MDHLVKVSVKNWYTFLLQKTSGSISGSIAYCERCGPSHVYYILFVEAGEVGNMGAFASSKEGSRRIW